MCRFSMKTQAFFLAALLSLSGSWAASAAGQELRASGLKTLAELEIGGDQYERRFFMPHLRFSFPARSFSYFLDALYFQRTNSRLQGEVDVWLRTGVIIPTGPDIFLEASLNHISRHKTSVSYPRIADANEALFRFWFKPPGLSLGLGFGGYLRGRISYDHLTVLNAHVPRLFGTEFSLAAELKIAGFEEIFYEFEFSAALSEALELFLRATRHYDYPPTTYLGLRVKTDETDGLLLRHLRFRGDVLPSDTVYKLFSALDVRLELSRTSTRRFLLDVRAEVPVFRDESFIGKFPPEWIHYPLELEYEKTSALGLRWYAYCLYDIVMPLDRERGFEASLGLGIGLRNQPHFDRLLHSFRYELAGGLNFEHDFDVRLKVGVNTTARPADLGADLIFTASSANLFGRIRLFADFGAEIRVRPFFGLEKAFWFKDSESSPIRWWVGLEFIRWLPQESAPQR
jgi:hypothetical protein